MLIHCGISKHKSCEKITKEKWITTYNNNKIFLFYEFILGPRKLLEPQLLGLSNFAGGIKLSLNEKRILKTRE